jgi:hypothetical protein
VQQTGFERTVPLNNIWRVTVANGQSFSNRNFGQELV